jgi:uridine kinase
MIGDKLVITDYHRQGADLVMEHIRPRLERGERLIVTVAGESGSGKSEIGHCLAELAEQIGKRAFVFGQDDYFHLPPHQNHQRRLEDIGWVGPGEVRLDLLDAHAIALRDGLTAPLEKPLVYFEEDRIGSELVEPQPIELVIAEGTYTSLLENADVRAFIDRTYLQTKKARLRRARDPATAFLERVLAIEHEVISQHKARADVVLPPPPAEQADEEGIEPTA